MKKILTFALILAAAGSMSAQKQVVDQASKMSGKADKLEEARGLIQQAMSNPETQKDARTYYVGGKLEYDAYDNAFTKQMINPQDKDVNPLEMSKQLINGYNLFIQALPLDSLPNEKGQVKPKYSKDIISKINGHFNDYFNAGGTFYNEKKYYPEAYDAFMIYGTLPKLPIASKDVAATPDSVLNMALFNAGISAYAGNNLEAAAKAFKQSRLNGTDNPQSYIYEIACWQYMASNDSTKEAPAAAAILEVAKAGYDRFGISQPLFVNNLVNSYVLEGKMDEALATVDKLLASNPDNASLYGLRGFINDRKGDDDASINDYKKAATYDDVDFETLKNVAKKVLKVGTEKWNVIEGASPEARQDIKTNYFEYAKKITDRAKAMNADDPDLQYVIENVDYALTTFFN